jgi:hypothetical protein
MVALLKRAQGLQIDRWCFRHFHSFPMDKIWENLMQHEDDAYRSSQQPKD